jgi:RNA polymerase sigma-70 factor (ECF subfamily)
MSRVWRPSLSPTTAPEEDTALGDRFDDVLQGALAGAPWAARALYDDLAGSVAGYLRLQGLRDADDVTSEVFLDVFRGLGSFEGGEGGFRSWVFTIAHRRWVDELRRRGRRPDTVPLEAHVDVSAPVDVESLATGVVVAGELGRHLDALTPDQRTVLLLRMVADLSVDETAEAMDRRVGAVKMLQRRALASLRRRLDDAGIGAEDLLG